MLTSVKYWLWLTTRLNPTYAWQVFCHFGSPEKAYFSDPAEYDRIDMLSPAQRLLLQDKDVSAAEQIIARCDAQNIRILTYSDTEFPERLRNIPVPPLVLYLRGRMLRFDDRAVIAFAGTRKATPYGQSMAHTFARDVTRSGGIVATGIVQGCDYCSAVGALRSGGPLLCVLAGGVDVPYYDSDAGRDLLNDVAAVGAIISENPPGTPHKADYFRRRNAILTGISVALLCVEAGVRSGTMSVAALANEQGREVFAIPANVGAAASSGTNDLLRQALAIPVLSAEDILFRFSYLLPRTDPKPDLDRWAALAPAPAPAQAAPAPQKAEKTASARPKGEAKRVPVSPKSEKSAEKKVDTTPNSHYIEKLDSSAQRTEDERTILNALADGPVNTESLIARTGLPASTVSATLTLLIVDGLVDECSGGRYTLV